MSELPPPWNEYARHQAKLASRRRVDGTSWGLEAGLNRLLSKKDDEEQSQKERRLSEEDVDRIIQNESRNERYRAGLRKVYLTPVDTMNNVENALDARHQLQALQEQVSASDWDLLLAVGVGHEYEELAKARGVTSGSLRVRLLRHRTKLNAWRNGDTDNTSEPGAVLQVAA